eukprot:TRINITY_DN749_c0_g2_i4.p1 TRINITY_DN749_c0_g2~~TRINITY_DN749_c0_g2_i4.p1  ORF type:complete len:831 (+),score=278.81 TRINITY_DN749_c0_g2_i4:93-2495(+)
MEKHPKGVERTESMERRQSLLRRLDDLKNGRKDEDSPIPSSPSGKQGFLKAQSHEPSDSLKVSESAMMPPPPPRRAPPPKPSASAKSSTSPSPSQSQSPSPSPSPYSSNGLGGAKESPEMYPAKIDPTRTKKKEKSGEKEESNGRASVPITVNPFFDSFESFMKEIEKQSGLGDKEKVEGKDQGEQQKESTRLLELRKQRLETLKRLKRRELEKELEQRRFVRECLNEVAKVEKRLQRRREAVKVIERFFLRHMMEWKELREKGRRDLERLMAGYVIRNRFKKVEQMPEWIMLKDCISQQRPWTAEVRRVQDEYVEFLVKGVRRGYGHVVSPPIAVTMSSSGSSKSGSNGVVGADRGGGNDIHTSSSSPASREAAGTPATTPTPTTTASVTMEQDDSEELARKRALVAQRKAERDRVIQQRRQRFGMSVPGKDKETTDDKEKEASEVSQVDDENGGGQPHKPDQEKDGNPETGRDETDSRKHRSVGVHIDDHDDDDEDIRDSVDSEMRERGERIGKPGGDSEYGVGSESIGVAGETSEKADIDEEMTEEASEARKRPRKAKQSVSDASGKKRKPVASATKGKRSGRSLDESDAKDDGNAKTKEEAEAKKGPFPFLKRRSKVSKNVSAPLDLSNVHSVIDCRVEERSSRSGSVSSRHGEGGSGHSSSLPSESGGAASENLGSTRGSDDLHAYGEYGEYGEYDEYSGASPDGIDAGRRRVVRTSSGTVFPYSIGKPQVFELTFDNLFGADHSTRIPRLRPDSRILSVMREGGGLYGELHHDWEREVKLTHAPYLKFGRRNQQ